MYVVNAQEMRELDRQTIEDLGIPSAVLMEVAGRAVAQEVKRRRRGSCKVTVLAGHGNNGGDGLVAARHLAEAGYDTRVWLVGKVERFSDDARRFWEVCQRLSIPTRVFSEDQQEALQRSLDEADVVVDSLLGIGLSGNVRSPMKDVIRMVNRSAVPLVVAADVPSGVNTDNGAVMGEAVQAHCTVTFAFPKWCHYLAPASELAGDCVVADIGIPQSLAAQYPVTSRVTDMAHWAQHVDRRPAFSHKGSFGHVLVVGGKGGMSGAPALASRAALKAGAGLVTTAVPGGIQSVVAGYTPEALTLGFGKGSDDRWTADSVMPLVERVNDYDSLAIGPGLGRFHGDVEWLRTLLSAVESPVVLDADALNILAADLRLLDDCQAPVILTPHPGEMARLLQREVSDVERHRPEIARELARETGAVVVLKGRFTITAFPDGRQFVNTTGTPAMAKAGSGDVLTGMIAANIAQGMPLDVAVPLAVSLHGCAGEVAAERDSEFSVLATDIVDHIGTALNVARSNEPPGFTDTFPGK